MVAQQLLTIRHALLQHLEDFEFCGSKINLRPNVGIFITMNPEHVRRTELPDNLKALFRPVSMMLPDYALIAEIMLYAEGFLDGRGLAMKMVKALKLCSEQLSQQRHYDYGMRLIKTVLMMAGAQRRRKHQHAGEPVALVQAIARLSVLQQL